MNFTWEGQQRKGEKQENKYFEGRSNYGYDGSEE